MIKKSVSACLLATYLVAGASAQEPKKASKDPNKKICVGEANTGTRLAKRKTCRTAAEWEEMRRSNQNDLDRMQRNQPGS